MILDDLYKERDDYIVRVARENPKLGSRKIAAIVNEKYGKRRAPVTHVYVLEMLEKRGMKKDS